jgi:hypothetical protein
MKYEQHVFDQIRDKLIEVNMGQSTEKEKKEPSLTPKQKRIVEELVNAGTSFQYGAGVITAIMDDGVDYAAEVSKRQVRESSRFCVGQLVKNSRGTLAVIYKVKGRETTRFTSAGGVSVDYYGSAYITSIPAKDLKQAIHKYMMQLESLHIFDRKLPKTFLDALGVKV